MSKLLFFVICSFSLSLDFECSAICNALQIRVEIFHHQNNVVVVFTEQCSGWKVQSIKNIFIYLVNKITR